MTANMSTSLYDRLASVSGVQRHLIKKILYHLAYDGELQTAPPGPEEFILKPGIPFAQRTIAIGELGRWLAEYSMLANREATPELRMKVGIEMARALIDGSEASGTLERDYRRVCNDLDNARRLLAEMRDQIDAALQEGGA